MTAEGGVLNHDDPNEADWSGVYDPTSLTDRTAARIANFDPAAPTRDTFADYYEARMLLDEADRRIDEAELTCPIPDFDKKRRDMEDFIRSGHLWTDVERHLDLPWGIQVRLLFPHSTEAYGCPLFGWDTDTQMDFEQDARAGMSVRRLEDRYRLTYRQARRLAVLFSKLS